MQIKRNVINQLHDDLSTRTISILVGARQVGKTFLLRQIEKEAQKRGLKTAFFDLEQPEDLLTFSKSDRELVEFISGAGDVVFIDEFHYLKNSSRLFKAIYDKGHKIKIFASGSSAMEIHTHLKESLAGRKNIYGIYPCCLAEIGQVIQDNPFAYYCQYGGMPGLVNLPTKDKKQALLVDILQSYLLKDIKALIKEENIRAFNNLLFLLAQYQGSITPVSNLANEIRLTAATIESYLEILSQTYVNFVLHSFSGNYANELKKSKKYYLYDLGIRNALLKNFSALENRSDAGEVAESFVFLELQKKLNPETEIRFWRLKSGEEVDFIWIHNQVPFPIEVKRSWKLGEIPDGLRAFLKRYPKTKKAFIVSGNAEGTRSYESTEIIYKTWPMVSDIPDKVA